MSVVINDFDITVAPPEREGQRSAGESTPAPQSQTLTPLKIERIERRHKARALRVRAH